jgi:hypothetical protein
LERFLEWIIGALVVGPILGILMGGIIYIATFFLKNKKVVKHV